MYLRRVHRWRSCRMKNAETRDDNGFFFFSSRRRHTRCSRDWSSDVCSSDLENEIEKLKQGDMLESSFGEFASESPALYETIIGERDRYMATRLREEHNPQQRDRKSVV